MPDAGTESGLVARLPRPTRSAALLLLVAVILELLGRLIDSTGVTVAAAAALGAVVGDGVLTPRIQGISVVRQSAPRTTVGVPTAVRLTISVATGRRASRRPITIIDEHPALPPARVVVAMVRPGEPAVADVQSIPPRRGYWPGGGRLRIEAFSPLGGFLRRGVIKFDTQTWVHPAPAPAFRLPDVLHGRALGTSSSPRSGTGTELFGIRGWRSGDSASAIHWRASARRSELVVMEREQPAHSSLLVIAEPAPAQDGGWEHTSARAAATAVAARRAGRTVTLLSGRNAITPQAPRDILDWFAALQPTGTPDRATLATALRATGVGAVVLWLCPSPPDTGVADALRAGGAGATVNCLDGAVVVRR